MRHGTLELVAFGVVFFALQVWYLRMSIKNGRDEKDIQINRDSLAEEKRRLEKLLKK